VKGGEDLDGNDPVEVRVVGLEDAGHPSLADRLKDLIAAQLAPRKQGDHMFLFLILDEVYRGWRPRWTE
jgi:hypothetical protein